MTSFPRRQSCAFKSFPLIASVLLVALPAAAQARNLQITGIDGDGSFSSAFDTTSNSFDPGSTAVGALPPGVAITPNGSKVYVANQMDSTISQIDTATNGVTDTINVSDDPSLAYTTGLAVSPDGSRLYATNPDFGGPPRNSTVSIFNTSNNSLVGTATTGPLSFFVQSVPAQGAIADFTASGSVSGSPVAFSAASAENLNGSEARYDWNFGDGATATNAGRTPSHTYASPGTYTVTLTVTSDLGSFAAGVFTGVQALVKPGARPRWPVVVARATPPPPRPRSRAPRRTRRSTAATRPPSAAA